MMIDTSMGTCSAQATAEIHVVNERTMELATRPKFVSTEDLSFDFLVYPLFQY